MKNGVDASHLPDASEVTSEDAAVVAFSQVLASVHSANGELAKSSKGSEIDRDADQNYSGLSERLREWLEKLHGTMKAIIHYLPHAASFSVTVGTTISVTMNFTKRYEQEVLDTISDHKL